jgi:hypothetical protein
MSVFSEKMLSMKWLAHARLSWGQVVDSLLGKRKTWGAHKGTKEASNLHQQ